MILACVWRGLKAQTIDDDPGRPIRIVQGFPPGGNALMLVTAGHAVTGAMYKSLPYRSVESFEMISTISIFPFILSTHSGGQFQSLKDLVAAARQKRDGVSYGAAGPGVTQHLVGDCLHA